jgi:Tol biopolymer transport system component
VFVRDTVLGRTTRIAPRGVAPDGSSSGATISRDGRFVAFASLATNLVPQDRNRSRDVFLFDRTEGVITLVSRGVGRRPANGASSAPSISADGAVVAFQSTASDLVCAPPCSGSNEDVNLLSDVFVFERRSGMIARVSGDPAGGWMEESVAPVVDASGTVVAFSSRHPIDATDAAHDFDLFVRVPAERP